MFFNTVLKMDLALFGPKLVRPSTGETGNPGEVLAGKLVRTQEKIGFGGNHLSELTPAANSFAGAVILRCPLVST